MFIKRLNSGFKAFRSEDSGTTALEFCLIMPLFAALAFFILGTGKALVASIHSASEARTAAWMQARLDIDIPRSSYRVVASKKAAGMDIQPPLCRDGASEDEDYLEDRAEGDDYTQQITDKSKVEGDSIFAPVTRATTENFYRAQCEVFDQKTSRLLSDLNVFIVQENAIVPNRVVWRYDETEDGSNKYDIACGYDYALYRGFRDHHSSRRFKEMFPGVFPREIEGKCGKS